MYRPIVLIVLDGWGLSNNTQGNVLKKAQLPTIDKINRFYPSLALQASGISVGLPWGEMGNSEVGHMAIGAGKIIYQNLPRISLSIQDGSFFENSALVTAVKKAQKNKGALHLMGLFGDGAVHSHHEHLYALLDLAKRNEFENVFIHIFTDGRDSSPTAAVQKISELEDKIQNYGIGKIATLCGRNWAMDRNNNWDRVEKSYRAMTEGKGELIEDPREYLKTCYKKDITDEFIEPAIVSKDGKPIATIQDGDSVIFFNFREDRARELTKAFILPGFKDFKREKRLKLEFVTMTEYEKDLPVDVAFPPEEIKNGLGETLSKKKKRQLRIAETEKYAHVTYFFNGGKETPWSGEDRILIPSPAVSSFDKKPEMNAAKITDKVIEALDAEKYDFILINYANPDMVGHTGNEKAAIQAVETVDQELSKLIPEVLKKNGCLLITADHGNVEEIKNFHTGGIDTEHSTNPVPLWYITPDNHNQEPRPDYLMDQYEVGGLLSDIALTILDIMEIKPPAEMNGESLLPMLK